MHRLALLLLLASIDANAIVIRDDVPDSRYLMAASEFPALADLPGEGHGVLIGPEWVVTAAHAVSGQHALDAVVVGGTPRAVREVVIHPGYRAPPAEMVQAALASGAWEAFYAFMESSDDLALVRLAEPVRDVEPVRIHRDAAPGNLVRIMGQGATGPGSTGHSLHAPHRTALRQGYNELVFAEGRWLGYRFDAPPHALPLEATGGSGDSGGPILVAVGDQWQVAGIFAWRRGIVVGTDIRPGSYGETSVGVRLAHYADWIDASMAKGVGSPAGAAAEPPAQHVETYGKAIRDHLYRYWDHESYGPSLAPGSLCPTRIAQRTGGYIVSVEFLPGCAFGLAGRVAVEDIVRQSEPLPYEGFEQVFQPEIRMVFQAAGARDRQRRTDTYAEERERERQWQAGPGMQRRRDEYANRCEFHLRWQMPKIGLTRQNAVNVTVDRAGRVVAVDRAARTPVERRLEEALLATPPCQAVPAELGDEAGRLKFGPLAFRKDD